MLFAFRGNNGNFDKEGSFARKMNANKYNTIVVIVPRYISNMMRFVVIMSEDRVLVAVKSSSIVFFANNAEPV